MAQKETHSEQTEKFPLLNLNPTEFAVIGKKRAEDLAKAQTEFLEKLQETNGQWVERMQSEAKLASDFASKLTSARSIPDAMVACQEWTNRHLELMAEDGKHFLDDTQKFMETGARLMFNGWLTNRNGGGT